MTLIFPSIIYSTGETWGWREVCGCELKWISFIITTHAGQLFFRFLMFTYLPLWSLSTPSVCSASSLGMPLWTLSRCLTGQDSYWISDFSAWCYDTVLALNVLFNSNIMIHTDRWMAGSLLVHGPSSTSPKTSTLQLHLVHWLTMILLNSF